MQSASQRLLGREPELAHLLEVTSGATGGVGGFLVLVGDPGFGKTALLADAAGRAASGTTVLRAHGERMECDVPFSALSWLGEGEGAQRSAQIESIVGDVVNESIIRPVVLVADNLQWMDPSSLRVVASLGRRASQLPLAVLGACRPTVHRSEIASLLRSAETLAIGALDTGSSRELARRLLRGSWPDGTDVAVDEIASRAAGSPFWIERLCAAVSTSSGPPPAAAALSDIVLAPLAELSAARLEILVVAALAGAEIDIDRVASVHGSSTEDVEAVLGVAVSAGLVETRPTWSFCHELVRDALIATAPDDRVDELQLVLVERASINHWNLSGLPTAVTSVPGAGESLLHAADVLASSSVVEAASLAERGWRALPSDHPVRARAAADVVGRLTVVGRASDGIELALPLLDDHLDADDEARLRVALAIAADQLNLSEDALAFITPAAGLAVRDEVLRAVVAAWLGRARLWSGDLGGAIEACDSAATEPLGPAESVVAATRSLVAGARGFAVEAVEAATITAAPSDGRPFEGWLLDPLGREVILAARLMDVDDMVGSAQLFEEQVDATGIGTITRHTACLLGLAANRFLCGDLAGAVVSAHAAESAARDAGSDLSFPLVRGLEAYLAFQQGDLDTARARRDDGWLCVLGPGTNAGVDVLLKVDLLLAEHDDDIVAGVERIDALWAVAAPIAYLAAWKTVAPTAVRVAASIGHPLVEGLVDLADIGAGRAPGIPTAEATALRCRGLAAGDRGALAAAAAAYQRGPRPIDELECRLEAADYDVAEGDASSARVHLDRALRLAREHRLPRSEGMAIEQLGRIGIRKRRTVSTATVGWDSLTTIERDVVELVANGLTNRAIGEKLYMSPRTVENHLGHVFAKLGLGSRVEVAAAFTTRTIAGSPSRR